MPGKFIPSNSIKRNFLLTADPFALLQHRAAGYIFTCGNYTQKPSERFPKQGSLGLKEIIINEQEKLQVTSLNINTGQIYIFKTLSFIKRGKKLCF